MKQQIKFGISALLLLCVLLSLMGNVFAEQIPPESLEVGNTYVYKVKTGTLLDQSAIITYWELTLTDVSGPFLADRYTYRRGDQAESGVEQNTDVSFLMYNNTELVTLASNENTTEITKIYGTVERVVYEFTQDATNEDGKIFIDKNSGLVLEKVDNWTTDNPTRYLLISWKEEDMVYEFGEIHVISGFPLQTLGIICVFGIITVLLKSHKSKSI